MYGLDPRSGKNKVSIEQKYQKVFKTEQISLEKFDGVPRATPTAMEERSNKYG